MEHLNMSFVKKSFLKLKDYSISGEEFELLYNSEFDLLQTHPQPSLENISKYYESENYISHTDSAKNFVDKLYQFVKKITLKNKLQLIKKVSKKGTELLDVGCGTGDFLEICEKNNWKVTGVEPNKKALKKGKQKLKKALFYSDLSEIKNKKFDVITLWHVLEHVPNVSLYIKNLKQFLNKNGVLIVAVPNFKSYDATYYKKFWAAYDVPRHLWHFSKKAIKELFLKENMQVVKIKPMYFDSFYVSVLSEKYKTGKNNLVRSFFIGCISNLKGMLTKEFSSHIYIIKQK